MTNEKVKEKLKHQKGRPQKDRIEAQAEEELALRLIETQSSDGKSQDDEKTALEVIQEAQVGETPEEKQKKMVAKLLKLFADTPPELVVEGTRHMGHFEFNDGGRISIRFSDYYKEASEIMTTEGMEVPPYIAKNRSYKKNLYDNITMDELAKWILEKGGFKKLKNTEYL